MQRIVQLTPPALSAEHIKEKIICIRAHRERIFQIDAQKLHDKLIIHNYGQGGAGWTFLFGCVQEAIRKFEHEVVQNSHYKNKPIAVIGAGCYGLLTAIMLARKGHRVRIIAKETENLPSHKAAGLFFPRPRKCSTQEEIAQFYARGMESYSAYLQIIDGSHPFINRGPQLLPAYFGREIDPGFGPYIAAGLIKQPEAVTINFGNSKNYDALEHRIVYLNATILMQELWRTIKELGISIIKQEIANFADIEESIIFNCAGLGAKKLTGDAKIIPVQGHLITLQQQPIEQLQYLINFQVTMTDERGGHREEIIYFAPKGDGIVGTTFLRGTDSPTANQHEFDRLIERCRNFFGTNF